MKYEQFKKYINEKYAECSKDGNKGWSNTFGDLFFRLALEESEFKDEVNAIIEENSNYELVEELLISKTREYDKREYYRLKFHTGTSAFYVIREFMEREGKFFKTDSDMACVMVYSKDERTKIYLNGNGRDGYQRVSIIPADVEIPVDTYPSVMFELDEGGFVSRYDTEIEPRVTLEAGRYYAYTIAGLVLIQKAEVRNER